MFCYFLIAEIEKSADKTLSNICCPLNKYQKMMAKELIFAAKHKNVKYYADLNVVSENFYNHDTIGRALGEISNFCIKLDLPLLSSLAVSKDTKMPSHGFNKAFNNLGIPEFEFCIQEMNRVYAFENWDCLLEYLK